jgi:hypothetical protein
MKRTRRRSRADWRREIALWRESGLPAREYAAKAELNAGTLTFWKYVLAKEARSCSASEPPFPPVELRGVVHADERFEVELAEPCPPAGSGELEANP